VDYEGAKNNVLLKILYNLVFRYMKKIICIFALIIFVNSALFIACDNKSEIVTTEEKVPLANPYDYIGEMHNKGLSEYITLVKCSKITDIESFTDDFVIDFVAKEIVQQRTVADQVLLKRNLKSTVSEVKGEMLTTHLRAGDSSSTDLEIDNSGLTDFQKSNINAIMSALEIANEDVKEKILTIEATVLISDKSIEEKEPILCAIAIAKYSFDFWTEYIENSSHSLRSSEVGSMDYNDDNTGLVHPTIEKIVKADLIGGVTGIVRGVVTGASATGLVFGPGGYVLTTAAMGVTGVIWGSCLSAGLFGWIW
jgi:hypothetical protein